ncbi:variant erythrocyte surface antigen-1 family protein [Babesia caballi]|uniref:Variant erythrocyte surface antigen-1 family protein n=1 Tax=Babesia caballi TaxID=5871 RepID=A0AAV4LL30_BABCB|nr:variant erythrocyte surface antigen-1 family protein [Babesia caballi]
MSAPDTGNKLTDCPSNLREAIDWILRVTGKDGGGSDDSTVELAKQLHMLLKDVSKDDIGQSGREAEVVKRLTGLLGDHESHEVLQGLITSLASGLATFIGYSGGILTGSPTPIITGAGIAPSNVAKVQVADAVLCFVIGFLRGLNRANVQISNASWETDVKNVIPKLEECLGTGTVPTGFRELVTQIRTQIVEIDKSITYGKRGLETKLKQVLSLNSFGSLCVVLWLPCISRDAHGRHSHPPQHEDVCHDPGYDDYLRVVVAERLEFHLLAGVTLGWEVTPISTMVMRFSRLPATIISGRWFLFTFSVLIA